MPRDTVQYSSISLTRRRKNKHYPSGGTGHLIGGAQRQSVAVGEGERDDEAQVSGDGL